MEYNVYVQHTSERNIVLVYMHVDDILLTGSCEHEIAKVKKVLMNEFEMIDIGNMTYFLGMKILYSEKGIILHQLKYELELQKIFEIQNCKVVLTPSEINQKLDSDPEGDDVNAINFKQLVGSLRYLCNTIPDTCYVVGMVSMFMSKLNWSHYQDAIRILRYCGCMSSCLAFEFTAGSEDQVHSLMEYLKFGLRLSFGFTRNH
ncbi:uncharacterized mitochondrial protein AtMg00810-like [Lathyrus oleraceus]|uniref:uncharacterized mitochondrial protein AtMg00810-like n=1 Tax=Pisum sativum TaxID=3888 RepID=UPI0021CFD896|nr:uncharacterized mitochondrial protein AtMg00810-like [Pisum sativum]